MSSKSLSALIEKSERLRTELEAVLLEIQIKKENRNISKCVKFSLDDFKQVKVTVNCESATDADAFLFYLHSNGMKWADGTSLVKNTMWSIYGAETCYINDEMRVRFTTKKATGIRPKGCKVILFDKSMIK